MRQDAIAEALCDGSDGNFWREIKKVSRNDIPLPISIDEATGKKEVVDLWKNHFEQLLNCVHGKNISELGFQYKYDNNMIISPGAIEDAINDLAVGKSCGLDGIYSEHLKYVSITYRTLLS